MMAMVTTMSEPSHPAAGLAASVESGSLLRLLTFLSPAFPVGAFSYSHGLEWQIDSGAIRSAEALCAWLTDLLEIGSGWNDAVLLAEAHRAAATEDPARLRNLAELAVALSPTCERLLESTAQGRAFLDAAAWAWPSTAASRLLVEQSIPYAVAVGAVAAAEGIALGSVLPGYLNAFTANLVSVGVRLIPIGQSAGLAILVALHPLIVDTARRAEGATLDDLGSATVLSDIASMRHEDQYSRVFRT
jgi:urease accessory protein